MGFAENAKKRAAEATTATAWRKTKASKRHGKKGKEEVASLTTYLRAWKANNGGESEEDNKKSNSGSGFRLFRLYVCCYNKV